MKFKDQRVGVFVDVQNLYYSAKHLFGTKVNFKEILKEVVGPRKLVRAIAYVIKAEAPEEQTFFGALSNQGYEVKMKDIQIFYGGNKKGDWDIGLAMDTIEIAEKCDVVVIASGDGDYVDLVHHLRHAKGCRVEVASFQKSTSSKLMDVADEFLDLGKNKKFLLK
ncbi:MAG: NYN domain-containing protein [bacterium]